MITFSHKKVDALVEGHLSRVHLDAHDKTRITQQRILQLAQTQFQEFLILFEGQIRIASIALIQHHLLAIVRPAFYIGSSAQELADFRWRLRLPQELNVVARIGFVHRRADDGAVIEPGHVFGHLLRRPVVLGKGDVEIGLLGFGLKGTGSIHGGKGQGPRKRRRLFNNRHYLGGDGDDLFFFDISF